MSLAGFEPSFPEIEGLQTHALYGAVRHLNCLLPALAQTLDTYRYRLLYLRSKPTPKYILILSVIAS
jgi:hypothetical protein